MNHAIPERLQMVEGAKGALADLVAEDVARLAAICKALAHPIRVRIVAYLNHIDCCVCGQIVDILPLAQSTVSQHLKILKTCGLVRGRIEGPRTCYCLDKQVLEQFKATLESLL